MTAEQDPVGMPHGEDAACPPEAVPDNSNAIPNTEAVVPDNPAAAATPPPADQGLAGYLLYTLSLPERAVRSTIGLAAGAASETAEFLVPQAFQSSKTYEIVVRNSLGFLTHDIAGVESEQRETKAGDDYLARKAVGNFVDLAGLATLHMSPLWILAIVSDVAYGTKSYVLELAGELQKQGLIDEGSTIHHVDDILNALQQSTGEAATLFDTPPISVEQLRESLNTTRAAVQSADYSSVLPEAELTRYWTEMRSIASQEDVSLLGVSGALTMHTLGKVTTVGRGTLSGVRIAGSMFNRHVLGHYVTSLQTMRERGFYETLRESSGPYIRAVWANFASGKTTWTQELFSGRMISRGATAVRGWFTRKPEPPSAPTTGPATSPEAESPKDG